MLVYFLFLVFFRFYNAEDERKDGTVEPRCDRQDSFHLSNETKFPMLLPALNVILNETN